MLTLSCHCRQIRIEIKKQPDYIHECNCTLCSKSGASPPVIRTGVPAPGVRLVR
jgi:hypothetical protein